MKNNNDLFYVCSLIEYIGRQMHQKRGDVVNSLGRDCVERIYRFAGVFHCDPIAKVATEFIEQQNISQGEFDNIQTCRYTVPDYWTMGEVYARLIEDICGEEESKVISALFQVYDSWISDALSNYNTDFYYQSRDYIYECFCEGQICA